MTGPVLVRENSKMGPEVYMFNLPPVLTCTPTAWCADHCYARRGYYTYPNVQQSLNDRLELSKEERFQEKVIGFVNGRNLNARKHPVRYIRLHASGDFYSAEYVGKWRSICEMLLDESPETLLRTTTRRRDLSFEIRKLDSLDNVVVRESLDQYRPEPKMGLPFAALDHLEVADGAFRCMDNCMECGYFCWKNRGSIKFAEF